MKFTVESNPAFVATALEGLNVGRYMAATVGVAHANGESMNMLARQLNGNGIELMGFFTPASLGIEGLPRRIDNRTTLDQLPDEHLKSIHRVGKGVGARLYNTQEALASWHDTEPAGLYGVKIGDVVDARRPSDNTVFGWAHRIGSHALKQVRISSLGQQLSASNTLADVVSEVHASYGNTDAVLMTPPPRAVLRQRFERHTRDQAIAPATFALIRHRLNLELRVPVTSRG